MTIKMRREGFEVETKNKSNQTKKAWRKIATKIVKKWEELNFENASAWLT